MKELIPGLVHCRQILYKESHKIEEEKGTTEDEMAGWHR